MSNNSYLPPDDDDFSDKIIAFTLGIQMELLENALLYKAVCDRVPAMISLMQGFFAMQNLEKRCASPILQTLLNFKGMNGLLEDMGCSDAIQTIQQLETDLKNNNIPIVEEDGCVWLPPFVKSRPELKILSETYEKDFADIHEAFNKRFLEVTIDNFELILGCIDPKNIHTELLADVLEEIEIRPTTGPQLVCLPQENGTHAVEPADEVELIFQNEAPDDPFILQEQPDQFFQAFRDEFTIFANYDLWIKTHSKTPSIFASMDAYNAACAHQNPLYPSLQGILNLDCGDEKAKALGIPSAPKLAASIRTDLEIAEIPIQSKNGITFLPQEKSPFLIELEFAHAKEFKTLLTDLTKNFAQAILQNWPAFYKCASTMRIHNPEFREMLDSLGVAPHLQVARKTTLAHDQDPDNSPTPSSPPSPLITPTP